LNNISDRLRELEQRLGPSSQRVQEIEAVSRRLIEITNRLGVDGSLGDVEAALEQVREARRRQQQQR
jgi:hypothetical protein